MLKGVLCFILTSFLHLHGSVENAVIQKIHEIPVEDLRSIEGFFRVFLLKEAGAYTLFGDKPVSFDCYFQESSSELSPFNRRQLDENKQIRKGWLTWQKYQHLFPSTDFVLKSCHSKNGSVEIVLINKERFIKAINENLEDFQDVLGNDITARELLECYDGGNFPLFDLLKEHHALLGELLGFGKRNAKLFQQRARTVEDPRVFTLKRKSIPSPGFKTADQECLYYQTHFTGAFLEKNRRKVYKFLHLPAFLADKDSQETKELQNKYLEQQKQIHEIYSHGNFLEITLQRFCCGSLED